MAMSRDPRSKFRGQIFFSPNSAFNIRKGTKFLVKKLFTSEVISQKPHGGGGGGNSAFRVKYNQTLSNETMIFFTFQIARVAKVKKSITQNYSIFWVGLYSVIFIAFR